MEWTWLPVWPPCPVLSWIRNQTSCIPASLRPCLTSAWFVMGLGSSHSSSDGADRLDVGGVCKADIITPLQRKTLIAIIRPRFDISLPVHSWKPRLQPNQIKRKREKGAAGALSSDPERRAFALGMFINLKIFQMLWRCCLFWFSGQGECVVGGWCCISSSCCWIMGALCSAKGETPCAWCRTDLSWTDSIHTLPENSNNQKHLLSRA